MVKTHIPDEERQRFTLESYQTEYATFIGEDAIRHLDELPLGSWRRFEETLAKAREFGRDAHDRGYTYRYYVAPDGLLWGYGGGRLNAFILAQLRAMSRQGLLTLLYQISESQACIVMGEVPRTATELLTRAQVENEVSQ